MGVLAGKGTLVAGLGSGPAAMLAEKVRAEGASMFEWDTADRTTSDEGAVDATFDAAAQALPSVDVVLQVVLLDASEHTLGDISEQDWQRVPVKAVRGAFLVARRSVQEFLGGGGGRLVTLIDVAGGPRRDGLAKAVTVPALTSLSRCVAKEYGKRQITANTVVIEQPVPDMAAVADVAVYLASDAASFVTGEQLITGGERTSCQP